MNPCCLLLKSCHVLLETSFLFRAGLVGEIDLEYFTVNLVAEKQYFFQIILKSSPIQIDKTLRTKLESSSTFVQICKTFEKTGGTMISFYSQLE